MALSPTITACLKNSCTTLSVTDTTGVYNATTNPGGWGSQNTGGADVAKATITIILPNGSEQEEDVTDQIPDPVTGTFDFTDITLDAYVDGIMTIVYTVTNSAGRDRTYKYEVLFVCQTRACVDNMWAEVACESCGGGCDLSSKIDDANLAEGLLKGLEASSVCCDAACINKILASIAQLCNWNNCNC